MKIYFVTETDEVCKFGDILCLTVCKDIEGGKVTVEKEVEFNEETAKWMTELGVVKEKESVEFEDEEPCDVLQGLIDSMELLKEVAVRLSGLTEEVCDVIAGLEDKDKEPSEKKK